MDRAVVYQSLRKLEKRATVPVIALCTWEAVALTFPSSLTPPLTKLAHQHKWVFPAFCALVYVHVKCYQGEANRGQGTDMER